MHSSMALVLVAGVVLCCAGLTRAVDQGDACSNIRIYAPTTGAYSSSTSNGNGYMSMTGQLMLENLGKASMTLKSIAVAMSVPGQAKPTLVPVQCPQGSVSGTKVACNYSVKVPVQASNDNNAPIATVRGIATTPNGKQCQGSSAQLMSAAQATAQIQQATQQYMQNMMGSVNSYVNNMMGGILG